MCNAHTHTKIRAVCIKNTTKNKNEIYDDDDRNNAYGGGQAGARHKTHKKRANPQPVIRV